ncbi:hypothetical protein FGIG_10671 [Fasciola gigantica]|uniref:Uncharacterized protein n=1 Tax=Fasciola gigantica TaxID=46835 RepID=A0A504YFH8_FASGI|nr:hypothetical protein FGIG_10671 [Fasciola gigantica]
MFEWEFEEKHRADSAHSVEDEGVPIIVTNSVTPVLIHYHLQPPSGLDGLSLPVKRMSHIMKDAGRAGVRAYGDNLCSPSTTGRLERVIRRFSGNSWPTTRSDHACKLEYRCRSVLFQHKDEQVLHGTIRRFIAVVEDKAQSESDWVRYARPNW